MVCVLTVSCTLGTEFLHPALDPGQIVCLPGPRYERSIWTQTEFNEKVKRIS